MGCFESTPSERNHQPTHIRGCTDIFWLCIYIIFWLLLIVVAIFSFVYGNPTRLINGFDSFGNTCGVKTNDKFSNFPLSGQNMNDKPYLFFLDMREIRQTLKICVKQCPTKTISSTNELYRYYKDTDSQYCRYDFDMTLLMDVQNDQKSDYFHFLGPCPPLPVYESKSILHRCIPNTKDAPGAQVKDMYNILNSWGAAQQFLADIYKTWPLITLICLLSLVLSIVMIAMLHWLTKIISWLICIIVAVASIAITIILWVTYYNIKHGENSGKVSLLEETLKNETALYVMAIIATIVMILLIMIIYFLRTQLGGLAALFEEAGKCMLSLPGLAGPPLLAFIALTIFMAFWVLVVVCLATATFPDFNGELMTSKTNLPDSSVAKSVYKDNTGPGYKSFKLIEYSDNVWLQRMVWIYLIGLIWTSEFIFACQQLTIAGAVAFWYFRKETDSPVIHSISKLVKYHLGSVAKGSFIITIFKIPRLILTYLYAKLSKGKDAGSECATCGLKCCICCFWFLEKFIRYLNHNAYTVIAIESINFCPAAGVAWNALMSNALQVATINGIGDFILFLGKLSVTAVCAIISILILKNNPDVNFYIAPVILATVFSFFIAHIILSLYEIVVDTLFLCVCEDRTINGNNGRWKESNLAQLLGEQPAIELPMQQMEMTPITKEPFSSHA